MKISNETNFKKPRYSYLWLIPLKIARKYTGKSECLANCDLNQETILNGRGCINK